MLVGDEVPGSILRERRKQLRLTQSGLGRALGVTANTIARWERGEQRISNPERLNMALARLSCDPAGTTRARGRTSAGATTGNLPNQVSAFIGRRDEVRELKRVLRTGRLATLTGAGGIGKTRLALHVGATLQDRYVDGIWFVNLAPISDSAFVPQAFASALAISGESHRPLVETIERTLLTHRRLIIVDNCEHLLAPTAELCARLLAACPGVCILATSREPLGIGGERVWRVPPLSLDSDASPGLSVRTHSDAVRLFLDRADSALPGFSSIPHEPAILARICARLDGIPLALELAAVCVAFLSPAQLLARLEQDPAFLDAGRHALVARHRTIDSAIRWSYDLLDAEDRTMFARLSVFAGGFSFDAAESVCSQADAAPGAFLDALRRLTAKSFVTVEPGPEAAMRYRLLEPLRDFGRRQLIASGNVHHTSSRHAAFYADLARKSNLVSLTTAGGPWLEILDREHDNLHAALRFLLENQRIEDAQMVGRAVVEVWRRRGQVVEARLLLHQLLGLSGDHAVASAGLHHLASEVALFQGDLVSARRLLERCIELCRSAGLPAGVARALNLLAHVEHAQGRFDVAHSLVRASVLALPPTDGAGPPDFRRSALLSTAIIHLDEGKYNEARALAQELLPDLRAGGFVRRVAHALLVVAAGVVRDGDFAQARPMLEESLAIWNKTDRRNAAWARIELARLAATCGQANLAWSHVAESLSVSRDAGDPWSASVALDVASALATRGGHFARAVRLAAAAAGLRERAQIARSPRESAWLDEHLGSAQRMLASRRYETERLAGRALSLAQACDLVLEQPTNEAAGGLSQREREVVRLVARGWSNRRIAEDLVISKRTAETHVRNVLGKLGLASRVGLAVWAVEHGLRPAGGAPTVPQSTYEH